jgi:hypothetical protein
MQLARFVRVLGSILVLVVAGCAVGCGSGARAPVVESKEAGQARAEGNRKFHEQLKKEAKANIPDERRGRGPKRGNPGP